MSQGSPGEEAAKCQEDRAAEGKVAKVDAAKPHQCLRDGDNADIDETLMRH